MKHILLLFIGVLFLSLSVQKAYAKNIKSPKENKRISLHQQVYGQNHKLRQRDREENTVAYYEKSDGLAKIHFIANEKRGTNWVNKDYTLQSNMYVIDSILGISVNPDTTTKAVYAYNTKGSVSSFTISGLLYNSLVGGDVYGFDSLSFAYDANGYLISELIMVWSNIQWVNYQRFSYTYDANGNKLSTLNEIWTNSHWVNHLRETATYDANGNQLTHLYEYWDNQWGNESRDTYTYDAKGNQLTHLLEYWNSNQWINHNRETSTYDASGNLLTVFYEGWTSNQWMTEHRHTYSYDISGNLLTVFHEGWTSNQWINHIRQTYTHDAKGNQLTHLVEHWENNQWMTDWRRTYTYDTSGNLLTDLYESVSGITAHRTSYKYFQTGLLSECISESGQNSLWEPLNSRFVIDAKGWSHEFHGYKLSLKYKSIITSMNKNDGIVREYMLSQNYPNPFNPSTTITYSIPERSTVRLSIFNTLGQKISEIVNEVKEAGSYEQSFNASQLSSGIYFYRIEAASVINSKTFVETKKMVLLR